MEPSSAPETQQPETPSYFRTPFQETVTGMGIFLLVLGCFFAAQMVVLVRELFAREPSLAGRAVDWSILNDPRYADDFQTLAGNGDVIAKAALWSGLAGLVILVVLSVIWKRGAALRDLLGLRMPTLRDTAKWIGIFILLGVVLEVLARILPAFRTDFMQQVLDTTTDQRMMVLGVGLMAPLFEESLLRGLFLGTWRFVSSKDVAVAISAGVFAFMHLQYLDKPMVTVSVLALGVVLGYARANSGSLLVPVLLHMLNNLAGVLLPPAS